MGNENAKKGVPAAVRELVSLVAENPEGMTPTELTTAARRRFVRLDARRIADLVSRALAAGALEETSGRLRLPPGAGVGQPAEPLPTSTAATGRPLRAVAVDLESVVRTTATEPFVDKRIFQIGVTRFGTDSAWVNADPRREWYVGLPDETWEIRSEAVRARHAASALPPATTLLELHKFTGDADVVVAYNGVEADFPLLDAALAREALPPLELITVDAYYLALAVWPTAANHRLGDLADAVGVDRTGLSWHDAADDAELLARLLGRAAAEMAAWPMDLLDLVASACADSPAWTLLRHLAGAARGAEPGQLLGVVRHHSVSEVAAVLGGLLAPHAPRRPTTGRSAGRGPLIVAIMAWSSPIVCSTI